MRQSKLFSQTTKTISSDIKLTSHKLLYQGGFIRESTAGRYYFLPLGIRVRDKIVKIIEDEMNKTGAQKLLTPVLHPIDLWKETNRTNSAGFELMKIKDRSDSEFALGGTAEEMMVDLVRKFNFSYRDLPFNIYQFSQKFRDEMRARGGLMRVREFLMKDAYSFHCDEKDFKREYDLMSETYFKIFEKLNLKTVKVESDNGYIGGEYCHEFVYVSEDGESRFLITEDKKYAAHEDVAKFIKENKNIEEEEKKLEEVEAIRGNSMEDGLIHGLPMWQQIKDVMFVDDKDKFILAVIRGDLSVNETKLMKLTGSFSLRHATEDEIRELGSEPGFISPVGMSEKVLIVGDESLRGVKNAYGGANQKNRDYLNINIDRDFKLDIEGDIAIAEKGFMSPDGMKLVESKGIEVGNIFQLGYHYSEKMNAKFTDQDGEEKYFYMGCYGIGVDRTLATIVEEHSDMKGIVWPEAVAPFKIHLLSLNENAEADKIYENLISLGMEVLYDDRDEVRAGEKFADSDLIGCPLRIVVSKKTLAEDSVEIKMRNNENIQLVKINELVEKLK